MTLPNDHPGPSGLPIDAVLPEVVERLGAAGALVLQAETGAGKTTAVPPALLAAPWLGGQRVVMLEPRRVAARAAAKRMAALRGEPVGRTIGYRVRFDTKVSAATRVEVVTEGVLTRLLQQDPTLDGIGAVIFDEFHERSIHADLGLALTLATQRLVRPDLRILVMSATVDGAAVARLLGDAPVVDCPGRRFPVEVRYRPPRPELRWEAAVAGVIREAVALDQGHILVFLPGGAEIDRVRRLLTEADGRVALPVLPLHGGLGADDQDAALAPTPHRRIILATAIAETSLTIEGVGVVVDGGRMRVPRFSPKTGMTRLETVRVTRASAEQRKGRAGRLGPGVCYRLWAAHDEIGFLAHGVPEIVAADLVPLALDLAAQGIADPAELSWLDPPPSAAFSQARLLLGLLGAVDQDGRITAHGRTLVGMGLHPRLAHMVVRATADHQAGVAADLAAILSDRDIAAREVELPDVDLRLRLDALRQGGPVSGLAVHRSALGRLRREAGEWRRKLGAPADRRGVEDGDAAGRLVALAFPDRVAERRGGPGRFVLQNGRGAVMPPSQPLARADYLAVAEVNDRGAESQILLAAPLDQATVEELARDHLVRQETAFWDPEAELIRARRTTRYGALVLDDVAVERPDPNRLAAVWLELVRDRGLAFLPWSDDAARIRQRLGFLHAIDPAWPDVSDPQLLATVDDWLAPLVVGLRKRRELEQLDLGAALLRQAPVGIRGHLDRLAPDRLAVPTGSRIAVDYGNPAAPVLAVRLQELFGLVETPRVAAGQVPVTLHLLSPGYRPVQVTRDLASFWRSSYAEVRKELRARYPKHHWPEDPLTADPVRGPKRRRP